MTKQDDIEDALGAREDILLNGQLVTWFQVPDAKITGGPSWEDSPTAQPKQFPSTPILFIPLERVGQETLRNIPNTEVPVRIEQALMPGDVPFVPTRKDYCITKRGVKYTLHSYDEISPSGEQPVLYTMNMYQE